MYSDRVSQGRAPVSPRDHIIFGGAPANRQAGTKFAGGGFPYLFVIVRSRGDTKIVLSTNGCDTNSCPLTSLLPGAQATGLWAGWKAVLWLALHGISWKVVGGVLLLLCCTPMILQALWPDNEYEINLAATLQCARQTILTTARATLASDCASRMQATREWHVAGLYY